MLELVQVLGGRKVLAKEPSSPYEWAIEVAAGMPVAAALSFKEALRLTNDELAALLGMSIRTLSRWQPDISRLEPVNADRLLRAARLFSIASDVLEDADAAVRWLKSPQRGLAGAIPLELAGSDVGARLVETLLGRMEHGVYT